jgi:hypothetical protein
LQAVAAVLEITAVALELAVTESQVWLCLMA